MRNKIKYHFTPLSKEMKKANEILLACEVLNQVWYTVVISEFNKLEITLCLQ